MSPVPQPPLPTFEVHISAPDIETLSYGVAYAHAQDNVCQTAQALVTVRGERRVVETRID